MVDWNKGLDTEIEPQNAGDLQQQLDAVNQRNAELKAQYDQLVTAWLVSQRECERAEAANQRNRELTDELEDLRSGGVSAAESCCGSTKRILVQRAEAAEQRIAELEKQVEETAHTAESLVMSVQSVGMRAEAAERKALEFQTSSFEWMKKFDARQEAILAAERKLATVIAECSLYPKYPLVHREKILALAQIEQPR